LQTLKRSRLRSDGCAEGAVEYQFELLGEPEAYRTPARYRLEIPGRVRIWARPAQATIHPGP